MCTLTEGIIVRINYDRRENLMSKLLHLVKRYKSSTAVAVPISVN
jgi:hypothetical protein